MERKLTITNEKGKTLDLMNERNLLAEVSNLGFEFANEYQTIGSNFLLTNSKINQNKISGTMYFKGKDPYQDYYDLVKDFTNQNLILTYNTVKTFKLSCRMTATTKKENTNDYRKADVTFIPNGIWFTEVGQSVTPNISGETDDDKKYPYTYPYTYGTNQEVEIESDTRIPSPAKITIYGPANNPRWSQFVNGKRTASGRMYNLTITESQRIVIDATNPENSIELQSLNGEKIEDVYRFSDFSTERFIYMREGINRIVINDAAGHDLTYTVEAKIKYESV